MNNLDVIVALQVEAGITKKNDLILVAKTTAA